LTPSSYTPSPVPRPNVPALTPKELADVEFLADQVEMAGLSFVRRPDDMAQPGDRLHELGGGHLGIVLKIENRVAFENLPWLMLAGLRSPPIGVMAAHAPVIWATQVLEDMGATGIPSLA